MKKNHVPVVTGKQVSNMEVPVLSRWWNILEEDAKHLLQHWSDRNTMARTIINANKCWDTTQNEISAWLNFYMRSVPLKA
jgi:hypothetical protein